MNSNDQIEDVGLHHPISSSEEIILRQVVLYLIEKGPGRTEDELVEAVYNQPVSKHPVSQQCLVLTDQNLILRLGSGDDDHPYRYFPKWS